MIIGIPVLRGWMGVQRAGHWASTAAPWWIFGFDHATSLYICDGSTTRVREYPYGTASLADSDFWLSFPRESTDETE